ncbi:hypothetical protein [Microcoleus sp. FACHB-68]|uniref:hypothetical protein n=1 Tax=Microcoleus sp. FACHB-68 TaxID=2692826 RepID=UPI00168496FC|nr:hypothetical protein [Microcoleus sp. FACHB-68]MBD1939868.1 hypothetical protein [Microcoleus sp. FACHB-68]
MSKCRLLCTVNPGHPAVRIALTVGGIAGSAAAVMLGGGAAVAAPAVLGIWVALGAYRLLK